MPALSQAKAFQLVGTGALMVVFGSGVFALLYVIHGEKYDDGEKSGLFDRNSAFWTSTPVVLVGLLGVLAGITNKKLWISLYMLGTAAAAVLSALVAIVIGIRVSNIRMACGEDTKCKNSDKAVLMGTIVLFAAFLVSIAIWACVKACQSKWGPAKKATSLHVVSEFRSANGPAPPPTVVIHPDSQSHPPREEIAVTTTSGQESTPSPHSSECEPMERAHIHENDDVTPKPTNSIDDSPQDEKTNPRGDGTEGSDTGYETVSQDTDVKGEGSGDDETGYHAVVLPGKDTTGDDVQGKSASMDMATGDDSPKVVEVHRDPIQDVHHVNTHDNMAFEKDELTTAL